VRGGADGCRVGFLPRDCVQQQQASVNDDVYCQVLEIFDICHLSWKVHEKVNQVYGFACVQVLSTLNGYWGGTMRLTIRSRVY
jgi:hypothetical protein